MEPLFDVAMLAPVPEGLAPEVVGAILRGEEDNDEDGETIIGWSVRDVERHVRGLEVDLPPAPAQCCDRGMAL
jgi:hypothetical protein